MLPNAEAARGGADREAKAKIVEDLADGFDPVSLLAAIVHDKGVLGASGLFELSQMDKNAFNGHLAALSREPGKYGLLEFGTSRNFIADETFGRLTRLALRILHEFHTKYPELAGLDAEKLSASIDSIHGVGRAKSGYFKDLASILAARNLIIPVMVQGKTCYRTADFLQSPDSRLMDIAERIKREAAAAGFDLLKLKELEDRLGGIPYTDIRRAVAYLREQEELWIIEGDMLFSREIRDKLLKTISSMDGGVTVAALRDATGVNRKLSLAMLDFLDLQGLTQRIGDKRILAG